MIIYTSCDDFRIRVYIGLKYIATIYSNIKKLSEQLEMLEENRFNLYHHMKGELTILIDRYTGFKDIKDAKIYENDKVTFDWKQNDHGDVETITDEVFWDKECGGFLFGRTDQFNFIEIKNVKVIGVCTADFVQPQG